MTTLYIDTSIVMNEGFFRSAFAQSFLRACALLQIKVVVPEVVLDEAVGNYPKRLRDKHRAFQKTERELAKLIDLNVQDIQIENIIEAYPGDFEDILLGAGVEIAPYPEVPAKELVTRAYGAKKPFKDSGEGHKDYLIWATIKSHILGPDTSPPNVFLTANVKDFCEPADDGSHQLHSDLKTQIEVENLKPEVRVSLKSVLSDYIVPQLEGLELEDIPDLGYDDIQTISDRILLDDLPQMTVFGLEDAPFSNDVSISTVGEAQIEDVTLAKADDRIVIRVIGKVEVELDGFMDKFEAFSNAEHANFDIIDSDWNDHVVAVAAAVETGFEISIFYSQEDKKLDGYEVSLTQEIEDPWNEY